MNNRRIAPVLALDIGNVAVHIDPLPLLNRMGFDSMEAFHAFDDDQAIWNGCMAFENGERSVSEFSAWFAAVVPKPLSVADVPLTWGSLLQHEIDGIADIVKLAVAHGVKPVFLSDICPIRYDMCNDLLSFSHLMAGAVLSYEVGRHKPHEDMYRTMEETYCNGGVPLLYADDLLPNIEAAASRGWAAYQFGTAAELRALLIQRLGAIS